MRVRTVLAAVGAAAGLVACGGGGGDGAGTGNPLADGDPGRGRELFAANCAACHGADATGTPSGPPLVHEVYEPSHHGDASFLRAVQEGVQPHHWEFGPMPAVPGLDTDDVADIIAHVRGLQREAGIQ